MRRRASEVMKTGRTVEKIAVAMAIFSTVLPVFITSEALRRIGANQVALFGALGPVTTIFFGWLGLDELMTPVQLARAACPSPDILITNAGGPPPGDFRKFSREDWLRAVGGNMLTPIELIKATVDGMISRRFGRIVNITSSAVKAPIAELALSNGARSGLTGFVAGLARQTVAHNVTINNLLPGRFWTDRLKSNTDFIAKEKGKTVEEVKRELEKAIPAGRFGTPEEFGELCAYLCSAQASYITGQNFLIDGGIYPGTF